MTSTPAQPLETQTRHAEQLFQFEQAVRTRDLRWMRSILEIGIEVLPPKLSSEALLHASCAGAIATVELLLRVGADPNSRDGAGETALYSAVEGNHLEVARALLAAGANPNGATDVPGAAPILCAVERGHLSVLKILIEAGAATNVTYPDLGYTLLHKAVHRGYREITEHLVKSGMDIHVLDDWGDTPLHTAVRHSTSMITPLLQLGANVNARSGNGSTPAICAAFAGDVQAFELLVSAGADPLALENHMLSVFDTALQGRRPVMAAWLLERYPSLAPTGAKLDDAFVRAVRAGALPVVRMLANLGADFGQKPNGRTLLQIAPRGADELKRLLRSLKSSATIESAMGDDGAPPAPIAPSTTL